MITDPDIFFPARNILYHYARLEAELGEEFKKYPDFKRIREARSVAIMMVAMEKLHETPFWIQMPKNDPPDAITTNKEVNEEGDIKIQELEVVTLNRNSVDIVSDFLLRTKLSGKKQYNPQTSILCHIDKTMRTEPWKDIHDKLKVSPVAFETYLLGRVDPEQQIYQMAQVHPQISMLITVDIMEEIKKRPKQKVLVINKDYKKKEFIRYHQLIPF